MSGVQNLYIFLFLKSPTNGVDSDAFTPALWRLLVIDGHCPVVLGVFSTALTMFFVIKSCCFPLLYKICNHVPSCLQSNHEHWKSGTALLNSERNKNVECSIDQTLSYSLKNNTLQANVVIFPFLLTPHSWRTPTFSSTQFHFLSQGFY